ncbi:MAG: serine/threonine protein kinase, partial [Deltaproteobacteria bacterium]|nr:serine/threonine protein kinase [Deltaproteobacteria bacterium]
MTAKTSHRTGEFEIGRVVAERYEILAVIGSGTSGTVYRARDLHVDVDQEIVALKVVHPHLHSDRQIFGRFRREVKILQKLQGPHLCRLLETFEDDGLLMIALEHVDGPSLEDYLDVHGPLPDFEALAIMSQVCKALQVAHDKGVVHRDLKPS